jgi:signal transduction histidine kinase
MRREMLVPVLAVLGFARPPDHLVVGLSGLTPHTLEALGQPIPFSSAVVVEAARRIGIHIEFRETPNGLEVDRALESGLIDLSPAAVPTSERRQRFYLSDPWWHDDLTLLTRAGETLPPKLDGKRIAPKILVLDEIARQRFPNAIVLPPDPNASPESAASEVCRNQADAALMTERDALVIGLTRPQACGDAKLSALAVPGTLGVSLMSRRDTEHLTKRLRAEIDQLANDGTLAGIAASYPHVTASSVMAVTEQMQHANRIRLLEIVTASLLFLAIAGALFSWRLFRLQRRLRADVQARVEIEQELRRSNDDLHAYAFTISHDLQEPLRMVSVYVDLLAQRYGGALDDQAHKFMDTVRDGAVRMSTMLSDLLKFSHAIEDADPPALVDANRSLQVAMQNLERRITDSGAIVTAARLPAVHAWRNCLEQVFQNLIENSLKYRRDDVTPVVEILAVRDGEMWRFSVADNGIGMKMEYADTIFRVFQRLHARADYGGNGIGLAISKRIVERHGGRIWVEWSEPGQGTRFCFTLPARQDASLRSAA